MAEPVQKIMRYVGKHGIVRPRDIEAIGLPREYLVRLHRQGKLNRPGRGIYTLPDADVTEHHSYAEVTKRVPEATVCLLSALAFPDLPAAQGWAAWLALFTVSPTSSPRVLIDGFGFSLVFGWVTAVVLGFVYNYIISR